MRIELPMTTNTRFAATALLLPLMLAPLPVLADHELRDRDIRRGAALYASECASCHGVDLEGQPNWQTPHADGSLPAPPHDQTGHTWHHDNGLLFDYVFLGGAAALEARGVSGFPSAMPGFSSRLTEAEVWDILAYIRSTWPERVQEVQDSRNPAHSR
jgi:mono/diheme cytochrome c family protein